MTAPRWVLVLALAPGAGCGDLDADAPVPGTPTRLPYVELVVEFSPGVGAGFGQAELPEIVLGPPGSEDGGGSLRVLSLGIGGEIVLDFGADRAVIDGPGPDLVVFENPFWISNDPTRPFAELGEVAVSEDGTTWTSFACDVDGAGMGRFPGCAGWTPTRRFDAQAVLPIDPEITGGDIFDLAEIGVARARFVRIRDLAEDGEPPNAGFDLDAVGAVHVESEVGD